MALTPIQETKIKQWLQSKSPLGLTCPVCHRKQWTIGMITQSPEFTPNGITIGGPVMPTLHIACDYCAHIMSFAAIPMGLVAQE